MSLTPRGVSNWFSGKSTQCSPTAIRSSSGVSGLSSLSIHNGDQGRGHPAAPPAQSQPGPGRILTVDLATGQAAVAASSRSLALQLLSRFMPDETCFPACPGTRHDERKIRQARQQAGRSLEVSSIGKVQDEIALELKVDHFAGLPVPQAAWPGREGVPCPSVPHRIGWLCWNAGI